MDQAPNYHPELIDGKNIWIFDLDKTLYPAECDLFAQIDVKMTAFIAQHFNLDPVAARAKQKGYLAQYGATMRGLMVQDGIDPHVFLQQVHDIDFSPVQEDQSLRTAIQQLPGRKIIYTNADKPYTHQVLKRLGLLDVFEGVHDIVAADLTPKPCPDAFNDFLQEFDVDPNRAVFFEDSIRNLKPARTSGMGCVWIDADCEWGSIDYANDIAHVEIKALSPWIQTFSKQF